jgi:hypothetical protein
MKDNTNTKTEGRGLTLNALAPVLRSRRGAIQFAIVYDSASNTDLENGCSVEYAVMNYGGREVKRIEAFENNLLITL